MPTVLLVVVIALYVIGLVLTGWGLFSAVITTQRDIIRAKDRIPQLERIEARQKAESQALSEEQQVTKDTLTADHSGAVPPDEWRKLHERWKPRWAAMHAKHDEEHASHGFARATTTNLSKLAQYESQWLLQRILDSNRGNLVLLGSGLVVTTIASITSLFG